MPLSAGRESYRTWFVDALIRFAASDTVPARKRLWKSVVSGGTNSTSRPCRNGF